MRPGLFQTEAYAREVTRLGHRAAPAEEIDRPVSLRLKRQELLTNPQSVLPAIDQPSAMLKDELLPGSGQRQRGSD